MGKLESFVLGLFPRLQQELIDAKITQVLNREYSDEIIRLRTEIERLRINETYPPSGTYFPSTLHNPNAIDNENASTSDAWDDEPLRKSKRQQCSDLEAMYMEQLEATKISEDVTEKLKEFYG